MWKALLLLHALLSCGLLGMVTHQACGVMLRRRSGGFAASYVSARGHLFTDAIVTTFVANFLLGAWIYTRYRYTARPVLEELDLDAWVGLFEFKEHLLAIGLFVLPSYWLFWRKVPADERSAARTALTLFLCGSVWAAFLIGHLVNNERGL